jgi:hypothetical protein
MTNLLKIKRGEGVRKLKDLIFRKNTEETALETALRRELAFEGAFMSLDKTNPGFQYEEIKYFEDNQPVLAKIMFLLPYPGWYEFQKTDDFAQWQNRFREIQKPNIPKQPQESED